MRPLPLVALALACVAFPSSATRATNVQDASSNFVSRAGVDDVLAFEKAADDDILFSLTPAIGDADEPVAWGSLTTAVPGSLTRRELVARYADRTGRDVSGILFYYCFGVYKIAVIIQQIYARYVRGHTRDARFARLNERVAALGQTALLAAETGRF